MNELEAVRELMTPEQREQYVLLCAARTAGVMTDTEYAQVEEMARTGKLDAYLAELRVRMRQTGVVGGGEDGAQQQ